MNFRYTYIGILNLDFYNRCGTLLFIVIFGVLFLMFLILLFFTRGRYIIISDLITWRLGVNNITDIELYYIQKFWVKLGRLNFYCRSRFLNFMQRENESLEIGWTLLPVFILLLLLVPSLNLLFLMDNTKLPIGEEFRTWMITGHQWYWEYKTIKLGSKDVYTFEAIRFLTDERFRLLTMETNEVVSQYLFNPFFDFDFIKNVGLDNNLSLFSSKFNVVFTGTELCYYVRSEAIVGISNILGLGVDNLIYKSNLNISYYNNFYVPDNKWSFSDYLILIQNDLF